MSAPSELKRDHQTAFRPIGEAAEATDALKDGNRAGDKDSEEGMQVDAATRQQQQDNDANDDGEQLEHPVEEIESLCMQCGENVSWKHQLNAKQPADA
jgi:hypothetical protein